METTERTMTKPEADEAVTERTRCGCCYRPSVDIVERDDELLVVADVPGARKDSIDVRFEDGMLELRAAVEPREPAGSGDGVTDLVREYGVGDYYRNFQVSEAVDAERISAEYADGVLTLHLPKSEAVKPRRIEVKAK